MYADKPLYNRKPRKDGTTRKARIFGRPYWYEKAGWSEETCNERRAAIRDRLHERWSNWSVLKDEAVSSQEVKDWIKPVVVTFDDSSWCLPTSSDPEERLNEQLSIYSEWAKHILRESSRPSKTNRTPDQNAISKSPQSVATSMRLPEHSVNGRYNSFTHVNRSGSYGSDGGLLLRWRQTRTIDGVSEKDTTVDNEPEMDALATTWNFSRQGVPGAGNTNGLEHHSDHRPKPFSFATPSRVERNTVSAMLEDFSDDGTEITEVSDSEPARQSSSKIKSAPDEKTNGDTGSRSERKWRDIDWDDVVVTVDAKKVVGEVFPTPMTMLKPGSNRSLCRWDDFELHDLHARLEVEAGQKIDWSKYMIASMVNSKPIAINTPGKYKLLLKEFSEKTRPGPAMMLCLRVIERTGFGEVIRYGTQRQNQLHNQTKKNEKRSQFTGAPSDFSSDSETESTQPPLKRQKHDNTSQLTSATHSELTVPDHSQPPGDPLVEQLQEASSVLVDKAREELKVRESPDEFTQESNTII